jgi:excisionase family DNA binding protein
MATTEFLDVKEAAELTGRTRETVRRWVRLGRLPAQRRGRTLVVSRADVMRIAGPLEAARPTFIDWATEAMARIDARRVADQSTDSAADLILSDRLTWR